jgi:hypothetical protein
MYTEYFNCICWSDIIVITGITIVLTLFTYYVIYNLKPKLIIDKVEKPDSDLQIRVINKGVCAAVNLRIEVCGYFKDTNHNYTYHFKIDHEDFLMLTGRKSCDSRKNYRSIGLSDRALQFKSYEGLLEEIIAGKFLLRIRIHSYHSFSGLGKAEEACFKYENNVFQKLPACCNK